MDAIEHPRDLIPHLRGAEKDDKMNAFDYQEYLATLSVEDLIKENNAVADEAHENIEKATMELADMKKNGLVDPWEEPLDFLK